MKNTQKTVLLYFNIFAVVFILFASMTFVMKVDYIIDDLRMMTPVIQNVHWNLFIISYTLQYSDFHNEVREYKILNTPIIYSALLTVINFSLAFIILPIYNKKNKKSIYASERTGEYVMGTVIEALPDGIFQIELKNGHKISAHTSDLIKLNYHRIQPGEKVRVEMVYDLTRGCITERYE